MRHFYSYYPNNRKLELPKDNTIGIFGPLDLPHVDREKVLRDAFVQPVNTLQLRKIVGPEDRVLIVLDDALEPTPTVFPFFHVIQELHAAGVPDQNISVLIANASHRTNTREEVDRKIGGEMHKRYRVHQSSEENREATFHTFGAAQTPHGSISVVADSHLRDATCIVGITGTYPNRFKGYSGAGSLIFPGLSSPEVAGAIYLSSAELDAASVMGKLGSPAQKLIGELLQFIPAYKFCVELVLDRTLQLAGCVTGNPQSVYRVSADVAERVYSVRLPEKPDILIIDSHPFDHNLLQAFHALYAASIVMENGGEIILVSPLLEHIVLQGGLLEGFKETRAELLSRSSRGPHSHNVAGAMQMIALKEVLERDIRVTFVSHGRGVEDATKLGFGHTDDVHAALRDAQNRKGPNARVAVITHGGLVVPSVSK